MTSAASRPPAEASAPTGAAPRRKPRRGRAPPARPSRSPPPARPAHAPSARTRFGSRRRTDVELLAHAETALVVIVDHEDERGCAHAFRRHSAFRVSGEAELAIETLQRVCLVLKRAPLPGRAIASSRRRESRPRPPGPGSEPPHGRPRLARRFPTSSTLRHVDSCTNGEAFLACLGTERGCAPNGRCGEVVKASNLSPVVDLDAAEPFQRRTSRLEVTGEQFAPRGVSQTQRVHGGVDEVGERSVTSARRR